MSDPGRESPAETKARRGRNIALAAELMEPARMYAWITFVIFTAIALNMVMSSIENRTSRSGGAR